MERQMVRVCVTATTQSQATKSAGDLNAMDFLIQQINAGILANKGTQQSISLTTDTDNADLIVFAESHKASKDTTDVSAHVLNDPIYRKLKHKCVIHNGTDQPNPSVPGLYPSIPHKWAKRLGCIGSPYLAQLNPFLDLPELSKIDPVRLASFIGGCRRKPIRQQLVRLAQEQHWDSIQAIDSSDAFVGSLRANDTETHQSLKKQFVTDMTKSKFVLCPRGTGSSSYRIFESMQVARVPVIIADSWSPPPGPDWSKFSIRVRQSQIGQLPTILSSREPQWESMGQLARKAWEEFYSPSKLGLEIVRLALLVLDQKKSSARKQKICARYYRLGPRKTSLIQSRLRQRASRIFQND
jgi:hypothetical protein